MKVSTVLDKIDEQQLFIPAFQREYVWKREHVRQLMSSLIKEYPVGTMLTWETNDPPELKGPHKYDPRMGAVKLLLDGQQRITTLYMLVRDKLPPYYTAAEINQDTRGLYVNLETLELSYYIKSRMDSNPLWQNITHVFQRKIRAKDVVRELENKGEKVSRERDDLIDDNARSIENILERDFPEQTIPIKATIREAIDIFYMVNASGITLTDAELALAQISGYWPNARDLFKKKLFELKKLGYDFSLDFIVYALQGCLYYSGSELKKLHADENLEPIKAAWDRLAGQTLDYVVNIMRTYAYVDHTREFSSVYALIPIIVYCFQKESTLTEQEIRKLVKWFYYSQIRTRYVNQLQQKLDRDLRTVRDSDSPFDELLQVIAEESRLKIEPYEFEGRGVQHPLFSLMRWYLKSRGAVCLTTGIELRQTSGAKYQIEYDHIFPYSRLKKAGYGKGNRLKYALAQEFTNRALLTQTANRTKGASDTSVYLRSVREHFPQALALQVIPEDERLWEIENYEHFLATRRMMLAERFNTFLNEITSTGEVEVGVSIADLIAEGESDELEFKSSLRWDVVEQRPNKMLEEVAMKTIAAFGNSNGGTLLIGVADDGTVLGLEPDLITLRGDRDRFELHLRNLLRNHFGDTFTARNISVTFHDIEEKEVCQIDVQPSKAPLVIEMSDGKTGQKEQRFYVRSGNSSRDFSFREMNDYVRDRFN